MSPYESQSLPPRRPLAVLPLESFLVRGHSRSSSSSAQSHGKPSPRARPLSLQLRDMSLLPSPFLPAASTSPAAAAVAAMPARPLATLYEASSPASRDASNTCRSSPKARLMMQEDEGQSHSPDKDATGRPEGDDDDDLLDLGSSPRRLYDAFVAVANRAPSEPSPRPRVKSSTSSLSAAHFVTERSQMPPPPSPRRTGSPRVARGLARPEEEPLPSASSCGVDPTRPETTVR